MIGGEVSLVRDSRLMRKAHVSLDKCKQDTEGSNKLPGMRQITPSCQSIAAREHSMVLSETTSIRW
jgi:hypothetical protein